MKEIIEYIRNKKKEPVGCVVAKKSESGSVYVGWSKYAENKEDMDFCKKNALSIARGRRDKRIERDEKIIHHINELGKIEGVNEIMVHDETLIEENKPCFPFAVEKIMDRFIVRCQKYFKTDDIIVV